MSLGDSPRTPRRPWMRCMESTAALPTLPPVTPAFMQRRRSSGSGRAETTAALAQAERYIEAHRYEEALEALASVHVPSASAPDLALRVLHSETWARLYLGDVETADAIAERAARSRKAPASPTSSAPSRCSASAAAGSSSRGSRTRSRSSRSRSASPSAAGSRATVSAPQPSNGARAATSFSGNGRRPRPTRSSSRRARPADRRRPPRGARA